MLFGVNSTYRVVMNGERVDVDQIGLELSRYSLPSFDITRLNGASEAVLGAVPYIDRFLFALETNHAKDRAEDLFRRQL